MKLLSFVAGVAAAFVFLPYADALTWPWVLQQIGGGYGWESLETVWFLWRCVLALLIFAGVRAGFILLCGTAGVTFLMGLIGLVGWRRGR